MIGLKVCLELEAEEVSKITSTGVRNVLGLGDNHPKFVYFKVALKSGVDRSQISANKSVKVELGFND